MPFSDEFHVARFRGTRFSGLQGTPDQPGVLKFTQSVDHAYGVSSYEVRVYTIGTSTVVAYRNLGKPVPYSNGDILVDITSLLTPLSAGNYTAKVTAVGKVGSGESTGYDFQLPLP